MSAVGTTSVASSTATAAAKLAEYAQSTSTETATQKVTQLSKALENLIEKAQNFGLSLIIALIILFVGRKLIRTFLRFEKHFMERMKVEVGLAKFLQSATEILLTILLFFVVISQLGIDTTSLITVLGTMTLAIGMSLQGSLANVAGGILILLMHPFRVGDYVITSYGEGTVTMVGIVYTTIETVDNKVITVPNGELSNSAVTDLSANDHRRVDITVGVGYEADLKQAREVLVRTAQANERVLSELPVEAHVDELADSSVNLLLICWVKRADYLNARWELNEAIKVALDAEGISIPYPQMDVHLQKAE